MGLMTCAFCQDYCRLRMCVSLKTIEASCPAQDVADSPCRRPTPMDDCRLLPGLIMCFERLLKTWASSGVLASHPSSKLSLSSSSLSWSSFVGPWLVSSMKDSSKYSSGISESGLLLSFSKTSLRASAASSSETLLARFDRRVVSWSWMLPFSELPSSDRSPLARVVVGGAFRLSCLSTR